MKLWKEYLIEKEETIHPKRKAAVSTFMVSPASDIVVASASAGKTYKKAIEQGWSKAKTIKNVGGGIIKGTALSIAGYAAYRTILSWFDKCQKECGTYEINGPKRQLCRVMCKRNFLIKKVNLLKQNNSDNQKIIDINNKIKTLNKKIELYKDYMIKHPSKQGKHKIL